MSNSPGPWSLYQKQQAGPWTAYQKQGTGTPIKSNATMGAQPGLGASLLHDLVTPDIGGSETYQWIKNRLSPRGQEIAGNAEQLWDLVSKEAGLLSVPETGEALVEGIPQLWESGADALTRRVPNAAAKMLRKPATPGQALRGEAGTPKLKIPFGLSNFLIPEGELGTITHPGPYSYLPLRVRPSLGASDVLAAEGEGIAGSTARPSGRLVRTPQEFATEDQKQVLAKIRAHDNGMMYAGGMRPAYGGRVPRSALPTMETEYPNPEEFNLLQQSLEVPQRSTPPKAPPTLGGGTSAVMLTGGEAPRVNTSQQRLQDILMNPKATAEDKAYARRVLGPGS